MSETPVPSFEQALEQLQLAVKKLESGELSLEDALKCFEDGVRLTRLCQSQLTAAEQKVEILMKAGTGDSPADAPVTQPFSGGNRNG